MGAYEKYRDTVLKFAVTRTKPQTKRESRELEKSFIDKALGKPVTKQSFSTLTEKEQFLSKLYQGLIELHSSLESLEAFEIYIGRFPYSGTSIKKSQYLRFIIESYLHEVYILKERTKAYITNVGRAYKKDYRHTEILNKTKPMFKLIPELFDDLLNARGVHVHQSRYTDTDLDRFDALGLFKTLGTDADDGFAVLYHDHYKETRKKWKRIMQKKNNSLMVVFNAIFYVLYTIVCTEKGNVRYPRVNKPNQSLKRGPRKQRAAT